MNEFLSKPFRPEELLSLIQHLRNAVMDGEDQKWGPLWCARMDSGGS